MGWFYGFKLHIVINHKGQIMAVDKGYISAELFKKLYELIVGFGRLKMIVGIKKGMKNILVNTAEKPAEPTKSNL